MLHCELLAREDKVYLPKVLFDLKWEGKLCHRHECTSCVVKFDPFIYVFVLKFKKRNRRK